MKQRMIISSIVAITIALAGGLAACAPQASSDPEAHESGRDGTAAAAQVAWSIDADCASCHATEAESSKSVPCLAKQHVDLGYSCIDCHADEQAMSDAHRDYGEANPPTSLKKTEIAADTCLSCHESLEAIAAKTPDVTLADSKDTAVNPHALPSSEDHDAIACTDCHVSHESVDTKQEALGTCTSCHHAGVFECGTCHT